MTATADGYTETAMLANDAAACLFYVCRSNLIYLAS